MLRFILSSLIVFVLYGGLQGQWYEKKYNVADIDLLSRDQLDESLKDSKSELLYAGVISAAGVGVFLAGRYLPYEIDDEASFIEQLIGEKGMKKIMMASGVGIAAGGMIAGIVYLARIGKINSVIHNYYASGEKLILSPVILDGGRSMVPGVSITFNF